MKIPEALKLISDTLWRIKNKKDMSWALEDLLTPSEVMEIADRIIILKMLQQWFTQREIAQELWISITTVSRGSRVLQYDKKSIHKFL